MVPKIIGVQYSLSRVLFPPRSSTRSWNRCPQDHNVALASASTTGSALSTLLPQAFPESVRTEPLACSAESVAHQQSAFGGARADANGSEPQSVAYEKTRETVSGGFPRGPGDETCLKPPKKLDSFVSATSHPATR